jgi:hypothetical protein
MAETFKEFGNQNYTSSDITNNDEIVIFTNNASTKAIIRDIEVQSNDFEADEAKFYVDGTIVGDTFEDSDGTVFVDESQSFSVKLNTALTTPQTETLDLTHYAITSSTVINKSDVDSTFIKGTPDYPTTGITTGSTLGSAVDIAPPIGFINPSNDYQYVIHDKGDGAYWIYHRDQNSLSSLDYVNSSGTRQQADNKSYGGGYIDGEAKKAYINDGGTIKIWDLTSSSLTPTTVTGFFTTNSTYSVGSAINGYYFYTYNGTSSNLFVRDTNASGTYATLTAISYNYGANSSYPVVCVAYNEDEEKFYILSGRGTSLGNTSECNSVLKSDIDAAMSGGTVTNAQATSLGNNIRQALGLTTAEIQNTAGNFYAWTIRSCGGPYISVPVDVGHKIFKAENDGFTLVDTVSTTNDQTVFGQRNSALQATAPATTANQSISNYTINNRIRTVGVEIT